MRPAALYDEPLAPPHFCIRCRAHGAIREWFVDTGAEVEWEGIVYICDDCFKDIVRVTPSFMSVESHRQIVAQYTNELDRLAEVDNKLALLSGIWMDLTGNSLDIFFDNLQKVVKYGRPVGFSDVVSEPNDNESTTYRDSYESESDNSKSDGTEPDIIPTLVFP